MQKFELVYRELVSNLATASGTRGLRGVIVHWLDTLQPDLGEAADEATRAARVEALAVLDTIRTLPDAYRETLVLRLVEGMTGPEIAQRTGLTAASVRVNQA